MSTREKLIKARLGMLALAEELQNITLACKRAGISRSHFYEIKDASSGSVPRAWRRRRVGDRGCRTRHRPRWSRASANCGASQRGVSG